MEAADDTPHIEKNPTGTTTSTSSSASFCFDCSICLDFAEEPVVTLCGHLYCWKCIYRWVHHENHHQNQPLCPVCKSPLSLSSLVPLYGRGSNKEDNTITTTTTTTTDGNNSSIPRRPRRLQPNRRGSRRGGGGGGGGDGSSAALVLPWVLGVRRHYCVDPYNNYVLGGEVEEEEVRSLQRISVFLLCCALLCLLLF